MSVFRRLSLIAAVLLCALPRLAAAEVTVFAAASTSDAIHEIGTAYAAAGGQGINGVFAASSTLAKQIENGAPAAIFISADDRWMDYLAGKNLLAVGSRHDLLGNRLVLIGPKGTNAHVDLVAGFPLAKTLGDGRLAVGDPSHVPAGIYAQAALEKLGMWPDLQGRLAPADSVRSALAFVERGEAPLGIVYATDAARSDKVTVVATFPEDSHPAVVYPAALIAGQDTAEAQAFFKFLQGPEARAIFQKYGFSVK